MTELIKNEAEFLRNCATDIETGEPLYEDEYCNLYVIDAHRIADLIDAVEERNKELTLQLLATSGQAADALDKLTKAMAGLRKIADYTHIGEGGQGVTQNTEARIARAMLAELEGGK
jgi:hypothetical protein